MKNLSKRIVSMTADAALEAALAALGLASHAGTYQMEEPKTLKNYVKKD